MDLYAKRIDELVGDVSKCKVEDLDSLLVKYRDGEDHQKIAIVYSYLEILKLSEGQRTSDYNPSLSCEACSSFGFANERCRRREIDAYSGDCYHILHTQLKLAYDNMFCYTAGTYGSYVKNAAIAYLNRSRETGFYMTHNHRNLETYDEYRSIPVHMRREVLKIANRLRLVFAL